MINGNAYNHPLNHRGATKSSPPSPIVHLLVGPKQVHIPVRQRMLTKHSPILRKHLHSEVGDIMEYRYRDKNMQMKAESPEVVVCFINWAVRGTYGKASVENHHKVYQFARKYAIKGLGQYAADKILEERGKLGEKGSA